MFGLTLQSEVSGDSQNESSFLSHYTFRPGLSFLARLTTFLNESP